MNKQSDDLNRDPISKTPGAHPVGVGVGGVGGAAVGAGIGALLGPIGMLIGGTIGAVAGAGVGKGVAEQLDPTMETEYWRKHYSQRPYVKSEYNYDDDYAPAYQYGNTIRSKYAERSWDPTLEQEVSTGWEQARGKSRLSWEQARDAARDAYDRSDRSYRTYAATDHYYRNHYNDAVYYKPEHDYYSDYLPAYRLGTHARSSYPSRKWDNEMEAELGKGWENVRGSSRLSWDQARHATKDAWDNLERATGSAEKNDRR